MLICRNAKGVNGQRKVRNLVYMDWKDSQSRRGCHSRELQHQPLIFADNSALLASSKQGLQHELNWFSAACDQSRNENQHQEVLCLSRKPRQCVLQVSNNTLQKIEKFKFPGVVFSSDGRRNNEPQYTDL